MAIIDLPDPSLTVQDTTTEFLAAFASGRNPYEAVLATLNNQISPMAPPWFAPLVWVGLGISSMNIFPTLGIIAIRCIRGPRWLFRYHTGSNGAYITCNTTLIYALTSLAWIAVMIPYVIWMVRDQTGDYQYGLMTLRGAVWIPLWFSAWTRFWGHAGIVVSSKTEAKSPFIFERALMNPKLFNTLVIGMPLVVFASVLVVSFLMNSAFDQLLTQVHALSDLLTAQAATYNGNLPSAAVLNAISQQGFNLVVIEDRFLTRFRICHLLWAVSLVFLLILTLMATRSQHRLIQSSLQKLEPKESGPNDPNVPTPAGAGIRLRKGNGHTAAKKSELVKTSRTLIIETAMVVSLAIPYFALAMIIVITPTSSFSIPLKRALLTVISIYFYILSATYANVGGFFHTLKSMRRSSHRQGLGTPLKVLGSGTPGAAGIGSSEFDSKASELPVYITVDVHVRSDGEVTPTIGSPIEGSRFEALTGEKGRQERDHEKA